MTGLLFGTGGNPRSVENGTTIDGINRIAELGLGCMEMEFVYRVTMGEKSAREVAQEANSKGIELSAHASYYINLNAREPVKIKASQQRLIQAARIASICRAKSVIFHTAFYLGDPPEKAYRNIKAILEETLKQLKEENIRIWLRPEVMGKGSQFGTIDEIIRLCSELEGMAPCIDFAHWHALTGASNSYQEFVAILRQLEEGLGRTALDNMHIHCSGIKYGAKGEIKHLNLNESDLQYTELLRALKDYKVKGLLICESPNLEEDALLMKETYHRL